MKNDERGSILAYVLVMAVVVMIISAGLARIALTRSATSGRLAAAAAGKKKDDGAISALISVWTQTGTDRVCDNAAGTGAPLVGYDCGAGVAGTCGCVCTPTPACTCPSGAKASTTTCPPTVTVAVVGGRCQFSAATPCE